MKKSYWISLLGVLSSCFAQAQVNLVANPSFETLTNCPFDYSQVAFAPPWYIVPSGSSDLFSTCGTGVTTVPFSFEGYQNPRTGNNYTGGIISVSSLPGCEYIAAKLPAPLVQGKEYCVEFYTVLAGNCGAAFSNIGMFLSPDSIIMTYGVQIGTPQILNPPGNYLSDTAMWMRVSGSFIANGGEQHFAIGRFLPASGLDDTVLAYPGAFSASASYYFYDDVSITECGDQLSPDPDLPDIFTPNNDGQNDFIDFSGYTLAEQIVSIYDRWGLKVFESSLNNTKWDGKDLKGNDCADGVYYYLFHYAEFINKDYNELDKKGFIHLIR